MKIVVRARGLEKSEELKAHAARRLLFALSRFSPRVQEVRVWLEDLNAQRGGVDKRCLVRVRVDGGGEVRVDEADVSAEAAIDRAADRAGASVARLIERTRSIPRVGLRGAWAR